MFEIEKGGLVKHMLDSFDRNFCPDNNLVGFVIGVVYKIGLWLEPQRWVAVAKVCSC